MGKERIGWFLRISLSVGTISYYIYTNAVIKGGYLQSTMRIATVFLADFKVWSFHYSRLLRAGIISLFMCGNMLNPPSFLLQESCSASFFLWRDHSWVMQSLKNLLAHPERSFYLWAEHNSQLCGSPRLCFSTLAAGSFQPSMRWGWFHPFQFWSISGGQNLNANDWRGRDNEDDDNDEGKHVGERLTLIST